MRIRVLSSVLAVLVMTFGVGCGPEDGANGPAEAARTAFERSLAMDVDGLLEVSCSKLKSEIEASREDMKLMIEMMGSLGMEPQNIQFDFSGLKFEVQEQNDSNAEVHVTGDMVMEIPGLGRDVQAKDETIRLVREDGIWKYCSGLY